MLAFATPWNLLNYFCAVGSGYPVMLQGDVTGKASSLALNKLGLGFNRLGGHYSPWTSTLIPAEQESEETYTNAYNAAKAATCGLIALPSCAREDCDTCATICQIRANDTVKCNIGGMPYTSKKDLAIDSPLGDQSHAWKNMCLNQLGVTSRVCQSHASSINGLNGGFRKHFVSQTVYEEFYDCVCRIMRCSIVEQGYHLQSMLVDQLKARGEGSAATWWKTEWTGHDNGTWMLGNGGIGLIANNQGIESSWRWDRNKISGGRQVTVSVCVCVVCVCAWTKRRGVWTKRRGMWTKSWGVWTKLRGVWTKRRGVWTKGRGVWIKRRGVWRKKQTLSHTHTLAGSISRVLSPHAQYHARRFHGPRVQAAKRGRSQRFPN